MQKTEISFEYCIGWLSVSSVSLICSRSLMVADYHDNLILIQYNRIIVQM